MKNLSIILLLLVLGACNTEKIFEGPNFYTDDFENYKVIDDLLDGDNIRWSFFQNTFSENSIEVDSLVYHSGTKSIKFTATNSNESQGASKASINKQFMAFWEGEVVSIEFWYYIEGTQKADWLFLFDLEEKTAIGAGPGMRLALENNKLLVEHKYPNPDIRQPKDAGVEFPRNQWVNIRFETKLSKKKKGYVKVWQDNKLILKQDNWKTLPTDILYFQQGTKGMYSQIEFGITANAHDSPLTVYVDDIMVKVLD